jgi:hypothetical protein
MEVTNIEYQGWQDCYQNCNEHFELVIPTQFGIQIIHFGFLGKSTVYPDEGCEHQ